MIRFSTAASTLCAGLLAGFFAGILVACVDDEPGIHARNVQVSQTLSDEGGGVFESSDACDEYEDFVRYRHSGKTLEVEWGQTAYSAENPLWQGPPIVDIYSRYSGNEFPQGVWVRKGSRLNLEDYQGTVVPSAVLKENLAFQNFVYKDEVLYITAGRVEFSYPRIEIYDLRKTEYDQRDSGMSFRYIGPDSLVIKTAAETVFIKYVPFEFLRAHSTADRPDIDVDLDSCSGVYKAIYETWLAAFLKLRPSPEPELEKSRGIRAPGLHGASTRF